MTDHEQQAGTPEEQADRMDQETDRVGAGADEAREKLDRANSDELIPEGLGRQDPAYPEPAPDDEDSP